MIIKLDDDKKFSDEYNLVSLIQGCPDLSATNRMVEFLRKGFSNASSKDEFMNSFHTDFDKHLKKVNPRVLQIGSLPQILSFDSDSGYNCPYVPVEFISIDGWNFVYDLEEGGVLPPGGVNIVNWMEKNIKHEYGGKSKFRFYFQPRPREKLDDVLGFSLGHLKLEYSSDSKGINQKISAVVGPDSFYAKFNLDVPHLGAKNLEFECNYNTDNHYKVHDESKIVLLNGGFKLYDQDILSRLSSQKSRFPGSKLDIAQAFPNYTPVDNIVDTEKTIDELLKYFTQEKATPDSTFEYVKFKSDLNE